MRNSLLSCAPTPSAFLMEASFAYQPDSQNHLEAQREASKNANGEVAVQGAGQWAREGLGAGAHSKPPAMSLQAQRSQVHSGLSWLAGMVTHWLYFTHTSSPWLSFLPVFIKPGPHVHL